LQQKEEARVMRASLIWKVWVSAINAAAWLQAKGLLSFAPGHLPH
jgi:hypothetical protein